MRLKTGKTGISPIAAIIILSLMAIAMFGGALYYMTKFQSGAQEGSTGSISKTLAEQGTRKIGIESFDKETSITIRNRGEATLKRFEVYIDGKPASVVSRPDALKRGEIGTITLQQSLSRNQVVKVVSDSGASDIVKVTAEDIETFRRSSTTSVP